MNKFKITIVLLSVFVMFFWYLNSTVSANNVINLNNFIENIELVEDSKKNISVVRFFRDFNIIKNNKCTVDKFDNYVEISATCLLEKNSISALSTEKSLDYLIDDLRGF
jgi:hypothetical protein